MCNIERFGDLLIKKGLINHSQLTKALEFQAKLSEKNSMPIGEILISFGFITRNIMVDILNEQDILRKAPVPPPPVGHDSVRKISMPGAAPPPPPLNSGFAGNKINLPPTPFKNQSQSNQGDIHNHERARQRPIGEILIEKGFLDRATLSKALQYQAVLPPAHYKPIGEILIQLNYISREQLDTALGIQPPIQPNALGEILKQLGFINDSMLSMVLMLQHSSEEKSARIGELLVQHGFISKEQLEQALVEQDRRK